MKKGFTLIELLVSIGIIAVLSAGVISIIGPGSARYSRDTKRQTDLETVVTALAMYRNDQGRYPDCSGAASCAISAINPSLSTTYLQAYPTDPGAGSGRIYRYRPYAVNASGTPINCNNATGTRCTRFNICAGSEKDTTTNNDASCGSATCGSASQHCVFVKANP